MCGEGIKYFLEGFLGQDGRCSAAKIYTSYLIGYPVLLHQDLPADCSGHFIHKLQGGAEMEVAVVAGLFTERDMDINSGHGAKVTAILTIRN